MHKIAVITFCFDRELELVRCIKSVQAQQDAPPFVHYVFSERVEALKNVSEVAKVEKLVHWVSISNPYHAEHSSPRMAKLRQAALEMIQEPYVCFLDDDNEILPNHLSSLFNVIEVQQLDAAYSWRVLVYPDGSPFTGDYYPWNPSQEIAESLYQWCLENGLLRPGDSIVYDGPRNSDDPRNVATVDMNEWLFRTDSIRHLGFNPEFSQQELANQVGEDDKLLEKILQNDFRFECTQNATVRYYLGGVSNAIPNIK
ncbi:hypothetical protein DP113_09590 [Brasilonema octagenarum UFV-E1]|uniref:Glycosyltransferase 2-like domain-containing protein n=2 Tax=Brasilonema TaxID=383614 RepID=A0A856MGR0_9CYAN|nr:MULTISPECIES: glycosyltransferase family A protein [Brasilonema]NMF63586.1 hypothetical protein [Brasilonema octagenarum UFV-OR1]QDL08126.1 hypothetical protein DP114_09630 [Brasilonema sennae CENA114]QDL14486.1 hypothetical protein DP113_09590 [Brasilonema octagenarum UFV-E1]